MVVVRTQAAAGQDALEKKVGMLETHQREIHDALASMEAEATRLYQVTPSALTGSPSVHHRPPMRLHGLGSPHQKTVWRCQSPWVYGTSS